MTATDRDGSAGRQARAHAPRGPARLAAADLAVAALLAVAAAMLAAATAFGRVYTGDGSYLGAMTADLARADWRYHNALYLPAAWLCAQVVPAGWLAVVDDPLALGKATSAAACGLGAAASFLCCRLFGAARWAALAAAALLVVTPAVWFFGSAIEVHAVHFAVVAVVALATLALPWRRPVLAAAAAAILFVVPCVSHQTAPLLGPGWILLVQCARRRVGRGFAPVGLLAVGAGLLAAVGVAHVLVQWRRGLGFGADPAGVAATVDGWYRGFAPSLLRSEVLEPFALLVPLALVACAWRALDPWLRACAATTLLTTLAGVLWWGVPERGGYLLGGAFVLAALAAALWSALPRRVAVAAAALVLAAQAALGWRDVRAFDAGGFQLADRVARVRQHVGPGGVLLSCTELSPAVSLWLPDVSEHSLVASLQQGAPIDAWLATVEPLALAFVAAGPVALELGYRGRADLPANMVQAMERLEAALRRACRATDLPDPSWPLLLLAPR